MESQKIIITVPEEIPKRARRALIALQVVGFMVVPYMFIVFLNQPERESYRGLVEGYHDRFYLGLYLLPMVAICFIFMYFAKLIALSSIASPIASLVWAATGDEELKRKVLKRFRKSFFVYGSKGVPRSMRRIRLSAKANVDGTYWMLNVDEKMRILSFQKYRPGTIREPNNPDLPSVKYRPGENPWTDTFK